MQVLKLANNLFKELRDGSKKSTIREGKKDITRGPLTFISPNGDDNDEVYVTDVRYSKFGKLSLDDAKQEGYNSVEELQDVLEDYYPDIVDENDVTIINYEY